MCISLSCKYLLNEVEFKNPSIFLVRISVFNVCAQARRYIPKMPFRTVSTLVHQILITDVTLNDAIFFPYFHQVSLFSLHCCRKQGPGQMTFHEEYVEDQRSNITMPHICNTSEILSVYCCTCMRLARFYLSDGNWNS